MRGSKIYIITAIMFFAASSTNLFANQFDITEAKYVEIENKVILLVIMNLKKQDQVYLVKELN